jgi:drug/metabolite transporter (DMT)-like permease
MRERTLGGLLVFGSAVGFGTIGIFGELAVLVGLPLRTMLPARFAIATVVVAAIALRWDWDLPRTRRQWAAVLALGVVYTAMTVLYFSSLRYLTAGLATVVLYTYPVFVVAVATATLDESLTVRKLLALTLALVGVAVVVGADTAAAAPAGVALAVGAAVCYACYTAGSRGVVAGVGPQGLTLGVLVGTTLSMAGYGTLAGGLALPTGADEWGIVLGLAFLSTVVPHLLFYEGVSRLEAGRVGVVSTAEPVVTVVLGVVLLGEPLTVAVVAGGALVLTGVVLAQLARDGTAPPEAAVDPDAAAEAGADADPPAGTTEHEGDD